MNTSLNVSFVNLRAISGLVILSMAFRKPHVTIVKVLLPLGSSPAPWVVKMSYVRGPIGSDIEIFFSENTSAASSLPCLLLFHEKANTKHPPPLQFVTLTDIAPSPCAGKGIAGAVAASQGPRSCSGAADPEKGLSGSAAFVV